MESAFRTSCLGSTAVARRQWYDLFTGGGLSLFRIPSRSIREGTPDTRSRTRCRAAAIADQFDAPDSVATVEEAHWRFGVYRQARPELSHHPKVTRRPSATTTFVVSAALASAALAALATAILASASVAALVVEGWPDRSAATWLPQATLGSLDA